MKELTIGQVARRARMQTSAIRYYESVGLLPAPRRVNGQRRYDPGVFQRLGLIQLGRQADFRVSELQTLFTRPGDWQKLADGKIAELDALIERAVATRAWLVEARKRQCIQESDCAVLTFDGAGGVSLSCRKDGPADAPLANSI